MTTNDDERDRKPRPLAIDAYARMPTRTFRRFWLDPTAGESIMDSPSLKASKWRGLGWA